jgi:fatty-acyl-CoA synthase
LTARALHGGWYHTADLGYLDEQGILFLTDRKSDMIITGGENVYPKEVEDVLYTHPAVRECSVVATPSRSWGEIVHAAVVLAPDSTVTADDLIAHCKSTLAGYKCPRAVTFLEFLPKTAVGKISKKDIKELIA